jgi:enoyl-CoA hydratase/carnithine racemase
LFDVLQAVRDDVDVHVMILRGNGRAFCSGGDVREFGTAPSPTVARATRWRRDVWGLLWSLPTVTVAAVHDAVVGSGFEMVLLCDICIAASDARFALPETAMAMIPGVGGTQTVPRHLGVARALDMVLTGRALDARAAQRLGIVSEVVAPGRLRAAALRRARQLASVPPELAASLKRTVNEGLDLPLGEALALERRGARGQTPTPTV